MSLRSAFRPQALLFLATWAQLPWHSLAAPNDSEVNFSPVNKFWWALVTDVGLAPSARVRMEVKTEFPVNNTYLVMLSRNQREEWRSLPVLTPEQTGFLVSFWRSDLGSGVMADFQVKAPRSDRYDIGVLNVEGQLLKLNVELSIVNPGGEHLPLQEIGLAHVLFACSVLFLVSSAVLVLTLLIVPGRGWTALHLLIVIVWLLKSLVLLLEWHDKVQVSRYGSDTVIGALGWQLLDKAQEIMELMMFLLLALGWKYLRGSLNITEIRFAVGVSVISFYLGVFEVACTTQEMCSGYQLSRYILHSLCYLVIIVAMNFNLQMLHSQLMDAPASIQAGKLYRMHSAYKAFRWIFLSFIVAPTVEIFLRLSVIPWDGLWAVVLITELQTWATYAVAAYFFRPDASLAVFELTRDAVSDDDTEVPGGGIAAAAAAA